MTPPAKVMEGKEMAMISDNPFRYSPPLYNLLDLEVFNKPIPDRENIGILQSILTPLKQRGRNSLHVEKLAPESSTAVTSVDSDTDLDYQFLQTPTRILFRDENYHIKSASAFDQEKPTAHENGSDTLRRFGTPLHVPQNSRLRRTVNRVLSYKEPSLSIKVRKGFKFFMFED